MIQHIEINGKQYPYVLSYRAIKKISQFQSSPDAASVETIEHALFWGLYSGHYKQKPQEQFDLNLSDMEQVLDDNLSLFQKVQKDIIALTDTISKGGNEGNESPPAM